MFQNLISFVHSEAENMVIVDLIKESEYFKMFEPIHGGTSMFSSLVSQNPQTITKFTPCDQNVVLKHDEFLSLNFYGQDDV